MAIFTLEAVKAKEGDCLLLHYGEGEDRRLVLIDGGPPTVYAEFLAPRLKQLTAKLANADGELPLELAMVSHVDQDHVYGILDLLKVMEAERDRSAATRSYDVRALWHNAFHKLAAEDDGTRIASMRDRVRGTDARTHSDLVLASVTQGQDTAAAATRLGIARNGGEPLVLAGQRAKLVGGLELRAIGPSKERVDALREEWAKKVGVKPSDLEVAALDKSVYNLSSLIVVATFGKRTMLLTGDGVSGDVVAGLADADLLDGDGRAHFDVLKVPHHGSDYNVTPEFFETIVADHYVISGDGKHENPELATLEMLDTARGNDEYDVWFTYRTGKEGLGDKIAKFEAAQRKAKRKARLHFPEGKATSLKVDLATAVDY